MNKVVSYLATFFAAALVCQAAGAAVTDSLAFDKATAASPAELLRGKVSGLRVHSLDGSLNGAVVGDIRGINSLRTSSHPLWIIDGVMVNSGLDGNRDAFFQYGEKSYPSSLNALAYLNAFDIESIEVIKDISATALYGIRGADGVIIVNTVKPLGDRLTFDWNSDAAVFEGGDGLGHVHSFNLSSTTKQSRYMVSGYYRRQEGKISGENSNYAGVRAVYDTRNNPLLWFGMNLAASFGKMSSVPGVNYFGTPSLTLTMRNPSFFPNDTEKSWKEDYDDNVEERRLTNSVWLTVNFTRKLSLKTTLGVDFHNNNRYLWYGDALSFGKEYNGAAALASTMVFRYNLNSELLWKSWIAQNHKVELAAGAEAVGEFSSYGIMNGTDFLSHGLRAKGLSLAGSKAELHKYDHDHSNYGFYGRFSYAFRGIAGADGVLRADKTPRYDSAFNLYGGANAWVDLHEALLKGFKPVSSLRLKGGFGEAGREQYVPYAMYSNFVEGGYTVMDSDVQMFFEALNRVRSLEYTAGFEAGFLNDRIKLAATWFDKLSAEEFSSWRFGEQDGKYWKRVPRKQDFRNSSLVANRGWEFDISADILRSGDWSLSVYGNLTLMSNQVLRVEAGDVVGNNIGGGLKTNINVVGHPAGSFWGYRENEDGSFIDVTGDGRLTDFDKDIIGSPVPDVFGGFGLNLGWRDLTLDIQADGAAGFDILDLNELVFKGAAPYDISESLVKKGDYLKLRRISLGYDVPVKAIRFVKGLQLRASVRNLFTLTRYGGYDPEADCFGTSPMSAGIDYGSFPDKRQYILGVSVKF